MQKLIHQCLTVMCFMSMALKHGSCSESTDIFKDYGVDVTYPTHHYLDKKTNPYFFQQYKELMAGCYKFYDKESCDATERARLQMSLDQPRSQHNYTDIGFKKIRAPKSVMDPLLEFYNRNKGKDVPEGWSHGYTYVNVWDAPSSMISFENNNFRGGYDTKQKIWDAVQPIIEEWVGRKVVPVSLYGIRLYSNNSILAPHADRLPLISSAIINVDQDVDEPWPIEVYGRNGKATNVTMEPGDMVLYESHTTIHGRPFKLKGRYFANVFVHYAPVDHEEQQAKDKNLQDTGYRNLRRDTEIAKQIRDAIGYSSNSKNVGGHETRQHDDEDIKKHKTDIQRENKDHVTRGQTDLHIAAMQGTVDDVLNILNESNDPDIIHARDINGWQPIHEAARSGDLEIIKCLLDRGADISATTYEGRTPLWWAKKSLDPDHEVIQYLESIGATADDEF